MDNNKFNSNMNGTNKIFGGFQISIDGKVRYFEGYQVSINTQRYTN